MDRVFLDANVLFSAAYIPRCRLTRLWRLRNAELLVSRFVSNEAIRNIELKSPDRMRALLRLLKQRKTVDEAAASLIPASAEISKKDQPVLAAAIACEANYLLTGDNHFRRLFRRTVGGVIVMRPNEYLRLHDARDKSETA